jgi:hypothetical protein
MVLNALCVCLLYSRFVENHPIWILKMGPSFQRWFCHRSSPPQVRARATAMCVADSWWLLTHWLACSTVALPPAQCTVPECGLVPVSLPDECVIAQKGRSVSNWSAADGGEIIIIARVVRVFSGHDIVVVGADEAPVPRLMGEGRTSHPSSSEAV